MSEAHWNEEASVRVYQFIHALYTAWSIADEFLQSDTISKGSVCINEEKKGLREGNPHTVASCHLKILKGTETGLLLCGEYCKWKPKGKFSKKKLDSICILEHSMLSH